MNRLISAVLTTLPITLLASGAACAGAFAPPALDRSSATPVEQVQYYPRARAGYVIAPRYYTGQRFAPGARYFAPRGYYGRPYWAVRPWYARPYFGTIVAGVALGTIVTVAAIGYVPPRPAANLCWYWADPDGVQGYWDYCGAPRG